MQTAMAASEDRVDQRPQPCLRGTIALNGALERFIKYLNALVCRDEKRHAQLP